jgi:muramoyltetrapeptide carboxypeptidase LdcA involved in peptidoglycan recycling
MTDFAFHQQMCDITVRSIEHALFHSGEQEVEIASEYNDIGIDWSKKDNLEKTRVFEQNDGLHWDGETDAQGILWGGCVESLIEQVATQKYLPSDEDLDGAVLFLETAEDLPEAWIVEYLLTGFGERGWLANFSAVLVGRPKSWEFDKPNNADQKETYKKEQRDTILATVREYNAKIPVIQNVDFGHTSPQFIVPSGNVARVDAADRKLFFTY